MSNTDKTTLLPIGNIEPISEIDAEFPDKYKLELYRLHAKIRNLEYDIKDKNGRLLKALSALNDELMFWRTGLNTHVWETMGEANSRVNRLFTTIEYLKDIQPHISPPLEIPERWKKKEG